jgi:hypothetical protein
VGELKLTSIFSLSEHPFRLVIKLINITAQITDRNNAKTKFFKFSLLNKTINTPKKLRLKQKIYINNEKGYLICITLLI